MSDDKTSGVDAARGERPGTLVTPDTAPEAIIQADREAAADLIETYWRTGDREGAQMQKLAQSYRDGHTQGVWAAAFARHRRLTSHSAGEGLREALATLLEQTREYLADAPVGHAVHEAIERADRLLLTPPSDAGSTTRSGDDRAFRMHYLGLLGLITEASPYVDEDIRDSMALAFEHAVKLDPSLRVRRIIDRLVIEPAPQPGEVA